MNLVLIGMRGSGKSTIGKLLAKKMDKNYYDLDALLEKKVGMTISVVVKKHGWDYFRKIETEIAGEISMRTNIIISTGGGIILRKKNIEALRKNGKFIYLKTSVDTIVKRIGDRKKRPSLTNKKILKEELETVWQERKKLYEQAADITVEADNKTPEEIVNEIKKNLWLKANC